MALSLISLNIERNKHHETFLPFLAERMPDVFCVMELYENDISRVRETLGAVDYRFAPMTRYDGNVEGVGIFSRFPITSSDVRLYGGNDGPLTDFDNKMDPAGNRQTQSYLAVLATIEKEGVAYDIAATHFTWTPDGFPDDFQRKDIKSLLAALEDKKEIILCGDFNAPRGMEIFAELAARYKDNIPLEYETSLDGAFHRAWNTDPRIRKYMVDGLFTTPEYTAKDVSLQFGVSDHAAIVATIEKAA